MSWLRRASLVYAETVRLRQAIRFAAIPAFSLPMGERQGRALQPHLGDRLGLPAYFLTSNDQRAADPAPRVDYYDTERRHSTLRSEPLVSRLVYAGLLVLWWLDSTVSLRTPVLGQLPCAINPDGRVQLCPVSHCGAI